MNWLETLEEGQQLEAIRDFHHASRGSIDKSMLGPSHDGTSGLLPTRTLDDKALGLVKRIGPTNKTTRLDLEPSPDAFKMSGVVTLEMSHVVPDFKVHHADWALQTCLRR